MVFGTILLLFALIGICNILNVSADTVNIPPLSYIHKYTTTLESKDWLWIDVDSDDVIDVYIMNGDQFDELQNSGGLVWSYCKRWRDIMHLHESFTITEDGSYYIILHNKDTLSGRVVDVDIKHYRDYGVDEPDNYILGWFFIIFVFGVCIVILVLAYKRYKRKFPKEDIKEDTEPEIIPIKVYCRECETEILDETKLFCPNCGTKQIN